MSEWSEAVLNVSFRSPGRRGFNLKSRLFTLKRGNCAGSVSCIDSDPYLSVSRDTQPWLGLLAKLFLVKGRFSSSGCRKNFLDMSMTRSTYPNTHQEKRRTFNKPHPTFHQLAFAFLTSSWVIPVFARKTNPTSVKALFSSRLKLCICSSRTSFSLRLYAPKSTTGMLILKTRSVSERWCWTQGCNHS